MTQGMVFNIQKFSIHDGPGIRTTVFLKGCPLRCKWCSNPESQLDKIQVLYDHTKCLHCQTCIHICPKHAITNHKQSISIDFNKCIGCLQCITHCPNHALSHEGEYKSVNEIVTICKQDIDFYEESNGGVTISGGEGMSQPDFLKALATALKKENIHLAIETTGYIEPEQFKELSTYFDLLLFDVKHYNTKKHQRYTGVDNTIILQNLAWALKQQLDILVRIPVIPGFNDTIEDAKKLALLLKNIHTRKVQLLPFHQFGEKKYESLNKTYEYKNIKALHPEELNEYLQQFLEQGIDCYI